jgi:chemotaxis protein CheY-P-specific phosphatase CheC
MTENLGKTPDSGFGGGKSVSAESLSDNDKMALGELVREIGQAQATALSTLTGVTCTFSSPFIDSGQLEALKRDIKGKVLQAKVNLTGAVNGEWVYAVPEKGVLTITNILIGQEDNNEVTDLVKNTFGEVVTQVNASLVSVLSDKLGKQISSGSPALDFLGDSKDISVSAVFNLVVSRPMLLRCRKTVPAELGISQEVTNHTLDEGLWKIHTQARRCQSKL